MCGLWVGLQKTAVRRINILTFLTLLSAQVESARLVEQNTSTKTIEDER